MYAGTENYNDTKSPDSDGKWINNMLKLFNAYSDVKFIFVNNNPNHVFPDKWNWCKNIRKLTIPQFISEIDLG